MFSSLEVWTSKAALYLMETCDGPRPRNRTRFRAVERYEGATALARRAEAMQVWPYLPTGTPNAYRRLQGMLDHESRSSPMSHTSPIVFVVDDDASVRESLALLIDSAGWQSETFASAEEFLISPRVHAPSCLVLDVTLPDLDGLELQKRVAVDRADMPIVFISGYGDVPTTVRAMKAGAVEFLTKPLHGDVMLAAIENAIECSHAALEHESEMRVLRDRYLSLTRREREVMALVVSGLLNKQVGAELDISEITVKAHRGNVMRKMKARSLADLVKMSARLSDPSVQKAA